ncbi:hypothetical protein HHK36_010768 [Tetracentron sinense]|uniref:Alpha 1,4-glycosyltransferase domain-containing protein n=1 Tax=Tetracentron sinense TaxID=13715 RepID=A0A835DJV3_TETSI|nr:hypothetical protein HHK36_010768 [Tetracentron sinense]
MTTTDDSSTSVMTPPPPSGPLTPEMVQQIVQALSAARLSGTSPRSPWYFDSGASNHMTGLERAVPSPPIPPAAAPEADPSIPEQVLQSSFHMKDLGSLTYYLRLEVSRTDRGILVSQRKYTQDLINQAQLSDQRTVETPMELNVQYVKRHTQIFLPPRSHGRVRSSFSPLFLVKEDTEEANFKYPNPLIPPFNVTEEERIEWFRKKLPEFEIFKSTRMTRQFAARTQKFFNRGCEIQFFMTWISPAKSFHQRELIVLESLFKAHPHGCLMILSRTMDTRHGNWILKPLQDRGFRVLAVTPDLPFLLENTPAEAWLEETKKGNKDPGEIPLAQNLSNLLRLAVLYKYGGVYMDTDFIVLKKLSDLKNSIGAQSINIETGNWTRLNNAVLVFDKSHPILYKFIEEFSLTFDGNKWGYNGPYLVSRVVERVATTPEYNVTVLPPMAFYPVNWNGIGGFFQRPKNLADSRWIEAKLVQLSRESYGVHLWNKQSSRLRIEEGSIIQRLITDHCVVCEQIYSS